MGDLNSHQREGRDASRHVLGISPLKGPVLHQKSTHLVLLMQEEPLHEEAHALSQVHCREIILEGVGFLHQGANQTIFL